MRWSCDTVALRDGPFGKPPSAAFESKNVVRVDSPAAPTPAPFALPPAPLPPPLLKPVDSLWPPPPQATSASDAAARRAIDACLVMVCESLFGPRSRVGAPPRNRQCPSLCLPSFRPPSSRGLGRRPLTAETGVRIPVAVLREPAPGADRSHARPLTLKGTRRPLPAPADRVTQMIHRRQFPAPVDPTVAEYEAAFGGKP